MGLTVNCQTAYRINRQIRMKFTVKGPSPVKCLKSAHPKANIYGDPPYIVRRHMIKPLVRQGYGSVPRIGEFVDAR